MADEERRARRWSIGGALLTALAASSCCVGPLLLAALGVGGVGATAALGAYRTPFLIGTAVLLIAGFYFTYRKPRHATGDSCGCARPQVNRTGKVGLWLATVLVVLVSTAPSLLAKWAEHTRGRVAASGASDDEVTIAVEGIDCEACAAPIRNSLEKVGGFHDLVLDIPKQAVTLKYESAPGRLQAYVTAINDLGYDARLPAGSEARR